VDLPTLSRTRLVIQESTTTTVSLEAIVIQQQKFVFTTDSLDIAKPNALISTTQPQLSL
jgi:hypothetical protein